MPTAEDANLDGIDIPLNNVAWLKQKFAFSRTLELRIERSNIFEDVEKMADLPKQITNDLEEFFVDYNRLEGKKFKVLEKIGPKEAQHLISDNLNKPH